MISDLNPDLISIFSHLKRYHSNYFNDGNHDLHFYEYNNNYHSGYNEYDNDNNDTRR